LHWLYGSSPTPSPPACGFRIASATAEPTEVVVGVSGEIDLTTSVPLADTLASHLLAAEPGTCVMVDLGTVTFIDVRGLRVLLEATATARSRGVVLAIIECPPCLSRLMKLTDTADLLNVC
jgi:anti-anti-sigma factor